MPGDSNGASDMESVKRFLSKFAMDVIRAVAASAVAALLFTHFQWTQTPASTPAQPTVPATANQQSTQLVRDEHDVMAEYLKAERAKERAEIEKEIRASKEVAAKEVAAKEAAAKEAAKEARDAKLARNAAEAAARQAELESRKPAPAPAPKPVIAHAPPAPPTDNVNAAPAAGPPSVAVSGIQAPVNVNPTPANPNPNPTSGVAASNLPPLNPPTVVQALPEPAPASTVEAPRDTNLADKAIDATHVKDVGNFMREVGGWFRHEDAPVPPADVRLSRYNNPDM
jgi:hypothetical protein